MTVYISHEVRGRDLSNALAFGELDILVPANIQVATDSDIDFVSDMVADRLEGFCEDDYLLLAGDPVCIGLACAWAAEYNDGRFKVLKWDRLEERYLPIQVDMWNEEAATELTKVGEGDLKSVADLVRQQLVVEQRVADLENELKRAQQDLAKISQELLPEALAEHGLSELKMDDGSKITVSQFIQAHISKEKQEEAFDWLRDHDHDDLIKNVVSLEFGKGEDDHARDVMEVLTNRGYWPQNKQSVHPSTLKAFVKEQVEKGSEIPSDLFGIFIGKKAVIKKGK